MKALVDTHIYFSVTNRNFIYLRLTVTKLLFQFGTSKGLHAAEMPTDLCWLGLAQSRLFLLLL